MIPDGTTVYLPDCADSGDPKTGSGAPEPGEYDECAYNPDCDTPCHWKFLEGECDPDEVTEKYSPNEFKDVIYPFDE